MFSGINTRSRERFYERSGMMNIESEPELADLLEGTDAPTWVVEAVKRAIVTDEREAAGWSDALALALGRRANRLLRERFGADA